MAFISSVGPLFGAGALADHVKPPLAEENIQEALRVARIISNVYSRTTALGNICKKLLATGKSEEAERVAQEIPDPRLKSLVLAWCKAGSGAFSRKLAPGPMVLT